MAVVIAIDAGTTGVRSRAVFADDRPAIASYREFTQHFPHPGWVEHDPGEIWDAVRATLLDVVGGLRNDGIAADQIGAIGITNSGRPWSPGTAPPVRPTTGRSCGRTGGRRIGAPSWRPQVTSRSCASAPAWCSTPTSLAPSSNGC